MSNPETAESSRSPQQVLMQIPEGMWVAQCVATAAKLGIADALAQSQPQGSVTLARAVDADPSALARFEHMTDNTIIRSDFKFDLNTYLASRPSAPVRTLEEILASGKYHKAVEQNLRNSQAIESRDTKEYLQHKGMRDDLREAILKAMADNSLDALAYPTI